MLGTAIIVFREVLEAALIVGIVLAASNNTIQLVTVNNRRTGMRNSPR